MDHAARVTSPVVFVSDRSVQFYRDVFSCEVTMPDHDAALLVAPGGFQLYLIARGESTFHSSGGVGLQHRIWAVESAQALREVELAVESRGGRTDAYSSGGSASSGPRPRRHAHPRRNPEPEPTAASPIRCRHSPLQRPEDASPAGANRR
jgi:hypothetical protein